MNGAVPAWFGHGVAVNTLPTSPGSPGERVRQLLGGTLITDDPLQVARRGTDRLGKERPPLGDGEVRETAPTSHPYPMCSQDPGVNYVTCLCCLKIQPCTMCNANGEALCSLSPKLAGAGVRL